MICWLFLKSFKCLVVFLFIWKVQNLKFGRCRIDFPFCIYQNIDLINRRFRYDKNCNFPRLMQLNFIWTIQIGIQKPILRITLDKFNLKLTFKSGLKCLLVRFAILFERDGLGSSGKKAFLLFSPLSKDLHTHSCSVLRSCLDDTKPWGFFLFFCWLQNFCCSSDLRNEFRFSLFKKNVIRYVL